MSLKNTPEGALRGSELREDSSEIHKILKGILEKIRAVLHFVTDRIDEMQFSLSTYGVHKISSSREDDKKDDDVS